MRKHRLLWLFLFLIGFLAAELHLRRKKIYPYTPVFFTHDGKKMSLRDGDLKLILDPFTLYRNLPGQKAENFTTNSLGLRGAEIPASTRGKTRLIVVGGSAAFGQGAQNNEETLEASLQKLDARREVLNAGVVGFLSAQEFAYVVSSLADLRPKMILAYDGFNDAYEPWLGRGAWGYNLGSLLQIEEQLVDNYRGQTEVLYALGRLLAVIPRKSALLVKIGDRIKRLEKKEQPARINPAPDLEKIAASYAGNMRKMCDFCRSRGIRLVVVLQPELASKSNSTPEELRTLSRPPWSESHYAAEFPGFYKSFREKSARLLRENGIPCIDINADPRLKESRETLFVDPVHMNKAGYALAAAVIQKRLGSAP